MELQSKGRNGCLLQCALSLHILSSSSLTLHLKSTTPQSQVGAGAGEEKEGTPGGFVFSFRQEQAVN